MSCAASRAISATEYGPGGDSDGSMPRLAKVTTRYPDSTRAETKPPTCHVIGGAPVPAISRTGEPLPKLSQLNRIPLHTASPRELTRTDCPFCSGDALVPAAADRGPLTR